MGDSKKDSMTISPSASSNSMAQAGKSKHRSPNYPYVSLKRAMELAQRLFEADKRLKVHPNLIMKLFGFKEGGSAGIQTIAALDSYGLVDVEGKGEQKRIGVSDRMVKYLFATNPEEQREVLTECALLPAINLKVWDKFEHQIPRDEVLKRYLVLDLKFNSDTVDGFIAKYKETIEFAGLLDGDYTEGSHDESSSGSSEDEQVSTIRQSHPLTPAPPPPPAQPTSVVRAVASERELKFHLPSGDARLFLPMEMDGDEFEILQAYLSAFKLSLNKLSTKVANVQES